MRRTQGEAAEDGGANAGARGPRRPFSEIAAVGVWVACRTRRGPSAPRRIERRRPLRRAGVGGVLAEATAALRHRRSPQLGDT